MIGREVDMMTQVCHKCKKALKRPSEKEVGECDSCTVRTVEKAFRLMRKKGYQRRAIMSRYSQENDGLE